MGFQKVSWQRELIRVASIAKQIQQIEQIEQAGKSDFLEVGGSGRPDVLQDRSMSSGSRDRKPGKSGLANSGTFYFIVLDPAN